MLLAIATSVTQSIGCCRCAAAPVEGMLMARTIAFTSRRFVSLFVRGHFRRYALTGAVRLYQVALEFSQFAFVNEFPNAVQ